MYSVTQKSLRLSEVLTHVGASHDSSTYEESSQHTTVVTVAATTEGAVAAACTDRSARPG